jgi:chromosome segregation ATPase
MKNDHKDIAERLKEVKIKIKKVQYEKQQTENQLQDLENSMDPTLRESISFLNESGTYENMEKEKHNLKETLESQTNHLHQLGILEKTMQRSLQQVESRRVQTSNKLVDDIPEGDTSWNSIAHVVYDVMSSLEDRKEKLLPLPDSVDEVQDKTQLESFIRTSLEQWKANLLSTTVDNNAVLERVLLERDALLVENEALRRGEPYIYDNALEKKMHRLAEELERDQAKIRNLQQELTHMQEINHVLKKDTEQERRQLANEIKSWKDISSTRENQIDDLKTTISKLEGDIRDRSDSVQNVHKQQIINKDMTTQIQELSSAISARDHTIELLTVQLQQHGITPSDIAALDVDDDQLEQVTSTPEKVKLGKSSLLSSPTTDSPSDIGVEPSQVKRIIRKFENMSKESLRSALHSAENELNSLRDRYHREKKQLQSKISSLDQDLKTLRVDYARLSQTMAVEHQQVSEIQEIRREKEETAVMHDAETKTLLDANEKLLEDYQNVTVELESNKIAHHELQNEVNSRIAETKMLQDNLYISTENLATIRVQCEGWMKKCTKLEHDLHFSETRYKKEIEANERLEKTQENTIQHLKQDLEAANSTVERQKATIESLEEELHAYTDRIEEEHRIIERDLSLEFQEKKRSIKAAHDELLLLDKSKAIKGREIAAYEETKTQLQEELTSHENYIDTVKTHISELHQQKEREYEDLRSLQQEMEDTRNQLSELQIRLRDLQEEEITSNKRNTQMEEKLTNLRKEISQKNQEYKEVEALIRVTHETQPANFAQDQEFLTRKLKQESEVQKEFSQFREQLEQMKWQKELLEKVGKLRNQNGEDEDFELHMSNKRDYEKMERKVDEQRTRIVELDSDLERYKQRDEQFIKTISQLEIKIQQLIDASILNRPRTPNDQEEDLREQLENKERKVQELTTQYEVRTNTMKANS